MSEYQYRTLGFIGLGAMGGPMMGHLADKLPRETQIYIFDVVDSLMDEYCAKYPNKIFKAKNARDVAEKSVRPISEKPSFIIDNSELTSAGRHHDHGARRLPCQEGLLGPSDWHLLY